VEGCWTCSWWTLSGTLCLTTSTNYASKHPSTFEKPEAASAVLGSRWWACVARNTLSFIEIWNNKFWYIVASCIFLYELYHDARTHGRHMYAAVYEKFSTLRLFRVKFLYAFVTTYLFHEEYALWRTSLRSFPRSFFVSPSAPQPHVPHSEMCSPTAWQFSKCHKLSQHLVQSWFCTASCFLVQTADGTTEDSDANASIDCCQLLAERVTHLWQSFPTILPCHVSKDLLVLAKFYVIHTSNRGPGSSIGVATGYTNCP
jgi:hypothetical protein